MSQTYTVPAIVNPINKLEGFNGGAVAVDIHDAEDAEEAEEAEEAEAVSD